MAPLPPGLPVLQRGRHMRPELGACLMEYVSVIAGDRFTDRPRCVDRLLVRLAWEVNDRLDEESRQRLVIQAPRFIGTATRDPLTAPSVVVACNAFAVPYASGWQAKRLVRGLQRARRRLRRLEKSAGRRRRQRWSDRCYRMAADTQLREALCVIVQEQPELLPELLEQGLLAAEEVTARSGGRSNTASASRSGMAAG